MKKLFVLMSILTYTGVVCGQVAKWLIPPIYDDIKKLDGTELVVTDSVGEHVLWSYDGRRLAATSDVICPFAEKKAVTLDQVSGVVSGFFKEDGSHTSLPECRMTHQHPFFSDGYLLVLDKEYYRYVNANGEFVAGSYFMAYPFSNGYASCRTFRNMEKRKDPLNYLLTRDMEKVVFVYNDKGFDTDDIDFISSVNDENIGVVIAKRKLYLFNGKDRSLTPVLASKEETNMKNQAKLSGNISENLIKQSDTLFLLEARCGKAGNVTLSFDNKMTLTSMKNNDGEYKYRKNTVESIPDVSKLQFSTADDKFGVRYQDMEVLPPQFDRILPFKDKTLFVQQAGKFGMIEVLSDENFKLSVNKGKDVAFRHQKYETVIRLDIPKAISAHKTTLEVDPSFGCEVDMTSAEMKDTEYGNYVQYRCVLTIPPHLPDEMYGDRRNEITYPVQILYDGLKSPLLMHTIKAWHYKYFNVDVFDSETTISHGDLSFAIDINAERTIGEDIYPFNISILTDSLEYEQEKLSEMRYKYKVFGLKDGVNNIVIQIQEQGCPPTSFPFEVTYTRPSGRTKKENVVITKKVRKQSAPVVKPHIDI